MKISKMKKLTAICLSVLFMAFSTTWYGISAKYTLYDTAVDFLMEMSKKLELFFDDPENIYCPDYPFYSDKKFQVDLSPEKFKLIIDWLKKFGIADKDGKVDSSFYKAILSDTDLFDIYSTLLKYMRESSDEDFKKYKVSFKKLEKVFFSKDKINEYKKTKSNVKKKVKINAYIPLVKAYTRDEYLEFNEPLCSQHVYDEVRETLVSFLSKNKSLFPDKTRKYITIRSYKISSLCTTVIRELYSFFANCNIQNIKEKETRDMIKAFRDLASSLKFDTPDFVMSELLRIFQNAEIFKIDYNSKSKLCELKVLANFTNAIKTDPSIKAKFIEICKSLKSKERYESSKPSKRDEKLNEYLLNDDLKVAEIPWTYMQNPQYKEYLCDKEKYEKIFGKTSPGSEGERDERLKIVENYIGKFKEVYEKEKITENIVWCGIDFESLLRSSVLLDGSGKVFEYSNLNLPTNIDYIVNPKGVSEELKKILKGKTLVSKIFMSTSISKTVAKQFTGMESSPIGELRDSFKYRSLSNSLSYKTLLKINIENFDKYKYIQNFSEIPWEFEALFPYNTKFKITDIQPDGEGYIQISVTPYL